MIYQVRANLYFSEEDEATDFYHDCYLAYLKSTICNPDTKTAEFGCIELLENHHDNDPNEPCCIVERSTNQPPPPV